jgi:hypothetical protein
MLSVRCQTQMFTVAGPIGMVTQILAEPKGLAAWCGSTVAALAAGAHSRPRPNTAAVTPKAVLILRFMNTP